MRRSRNEICWLGELNVRVERLRRWRKLWSSGTLSDQAKKTSSRYLCHRMTWEENEGCCESLSSRTLTKTSVTRGERGAARSQAVLEKVCVGPKEANVSAKTDSESPWQLTGDRDSRSHVSFLEDVTGILVCVHVIYLIWLFQAPRTFSRKWRPTDIFPKMTSSDIFPEMEGCRNFGFRCEGVGEKGRKTYR